MGTGTNLTPKEKRCSLRQALDYAMTIPIDEMPPCFDIEEDFRLWHAYNRTIPYRSRASSPCDDCTPGFCRRMKALGRCYPEIQIVDTPKLGEVVRPNYKKWVDKRLAIIRHSSEFRLLRIKEIKAKEARNMEKYVKRGFKFYVQKKEGCNEGI